MAEDLVRTVGRPTKLSRKIQETVARVEELEAEQRELTARRDDLRRLATEEAQEMGWTARRKAIKQAENKAREVGELLGFNRGLVERLQKEEKTGALDKMLVTRTQLKQEARGIVGDLMKRLQAVQKAAETWLWWNERFDSNTQAIRELAGTLGGNAELPGLYNRLSHEQGLRCPWQRVGGLENSKLLQVCMEDMAQQIRTGGSVAPPGSVINAVLNMADEYPDSFGEEG